MKGLFLAAILAALLLSACGPAAGEEVEIRPGSHGCRTWFDAAGSWVDCDPAGGLAGVVEDHPNGLGHELNGRVRVQTAAFGPLWFEPGDLTKVPKK